MADSEKAKKDDKRIDMSPGSALWEPQPLKPGPETLALKRFHVNSTWTGTVKTGAMGPDSPKMSAKDKGTFEWILDNLWVVGDFEQDQFVADKKAVTWKAHYVAGWDFRSQEYRRP